MSRNANLQFIVRPDNYYTDLEALPEIYETARLWKVEPIFFPNIKLSYMELIEEREAKGNTGEWVFYFAITEENGRIYISATDEDLY